MDGSIASWLLIAVALAAANLPFLNESVFGFIPLKPTQPEGVRRKPFWLRLLELIVLYFAVGALAIVLEGRIGSVFAQGWEFYAINGCVFVVFAFPGFVLRYLRKRRH
ncbi:MAG: DUF2818 family protein [Pseudomonadota bacterium]